MRLNWNEIRTRAAEFAREWAGQGYEKGQTQLFYRDFFDVFGVPVRRVASFEAPVRRLEEEGRRGYLDLFWKGVLLVEQKSMGLSLEKAKEQALNYFPSLKDHELPRYILLSDFQTFELHDLEDDEVLKFPLEELPTHVEKFGFIVGVQKRTFQDQDPVNIDASELVGKLHDALEANGYSGHQLERFLVRIVFCLFADDTGIFDPRELFQDFITERTREDGSDLGGWLTQIFQVLNTPVDKRESTLDEDLNKFPYVNGDLFEEHLRIPSFNSEMRNRLIEASHFDWSKISPAIFGSLFQSIMDRGQRRALGAHYTTEKNILKVIQPLFLDDLRAEFERLKARRDSRRRTELQNFHMRLTRMTFFDPACGCGNFLIIAYREMRQLELELISEIREYDRDEHTGRFTAQLDAASLSRINVDQFYGIEIGEFPARIAETALWMMDHIMNNRLSLAFGQTFARIPLSTSPHIRNVDALEMEWADLLPPERCDYLLGNPPFGGSKYQTPQQRQQVRRIAGLGGSGGTLDFVSAWFIRAGEYLQANQQIRIGFVATNSITQGEQVAQLWPTLFERYGLEIVFAHRTFAWGSDARGQANVHVVILGLNTAAHAPRVKRLFLYDNIKGDPHESRPTAITAYLNDGGLLSDHHIVVREASRPLNGLPRLISGTQPIDNGNYILPPEARDELVQAEPGASRFIHPYIGSQEYLGDRERWILNLQDASPDELRQLPNVLQRMRAVRDYRRGSGRKSTLALAEYPTRYNVSVVPEEPYLVIPKVSSERREYVPIGWIEPPTIPSDLLFVLMGATRPLFGILTSSMHMAWLRQIGGRLKSDYRYSIGLVYNTFPMPPVPTSRIDRLEPLAQAVLDARAKHPGVSQSDLYDPDLMPPSLRRAHQNLDRAVDQLYRQKRFKSERERAEHLLGLYESSVAPLLATPRRTRRRSRGGTAAATS